MALTDDPVVVDGEIVFAAWHNSQRNHAVRVAADVTALEAIDGLTDGMLGWASTTGQLYHRRGGAWSAVPTIQRVTSLPVTIPIPSAVQTVTVTGRLFTGGTELAFLDTLGARFNGISTTTYYRVLESVSNSAAFARDFGSGGFARLGAIPRNVNSNMALTSTIDAGLCSWQSTMFGIRSATVWTQERIAGSFLSPQRLTSLELYVSGVGVPSTVDLRVAFG